MSVDTQLFFGANGGDFKAAIVSCSSEHQSTFDSVWTHYTSKAAFTPTVTRLHSDSMAKSDLPLSLRRASASRLVAWQLWALQAINHLILSHLKSGRSSWKHLTFQVTSRLVMLSIWWSVRVENTVWCANMARCPLTVNKAIRVCVREREGGIYFTVTIHF